MVHMWMVIEAKGLLVSIRVQGDVRCCWLRLPPSERDIAEICVVKGFSLNPKPQTPTRHA